MNYGSFHRWCTHCGCILFLTLAHVTHAAWYADLRLTIPSAEGTAALQWWNGSTWSTQSTHTYGADGLAGGYRRNPYGNVPSGDTGLLRWATSVAHYPSSAGMSATLGTNSAAAPITEFNGVPPPPGSWHLRVDLVNDSAVPRRFQLDIDCDGIADTTITVPPGGTHAVDIDSDTEPTCDIVITTEEYLGDAQWQWVEAGTIPTSEWTEDMPDPTPEQLPIVKPPPPPDTQSVTNPVIAFPVPNGTNVADNTFRTGVESLRTAQIEKGDEIVEAVDRLRRDATNALGANINTNLVLASATTTAQNSSNLVKTSLMVLTNQFGTNFGPMLPGMSQPPDTRRRLDIGLDANLYSVSIDPNDYPVMEGFLVFLKSILTWGIWFSYGGWLLYTTTDSLKLAATTPSQPSSSQIPAVSWGLALGAAALVAVTLASASVAGVTYVLLQLQAGTWSGASDWRAWQYLAEAIWWGEQFTPLILFFGLLLSIMPTKLAIDATTLGLMAAIRAITA